MLRFRIEQWEVGEKVEHPHKKRLYLSVRKFTMETNLPLSNFSDSTTMTPPTPKERAKGRRRRPICEYYKNGIGQKSQNKK